jgi:glycerophosphoryl diester phosphodiesterase
MAEGVALRLRGHTVHLKWHRLHRRRSDPVFTGVRLAEGLALGASMEVDLRVHAGGGFAVLHEESLEHETTGIGPIASASADYLRSLRIRSEDGAPTGNPVLLLEDLIGLLRTHGAYGARVQLDVKDTVDRLTPAAIANFAEMVGDFGPNLIVSGGDWAAVSALATNALGVRSGYDPCDLPEARKIESTGDAADFVALTERIAPGAAMIYLAYPLVLHARDLGYDAVAAFHAHGQEVDAWTLNTDHADAATSLRRLVECRVDQITTDEPTRMEEFWDEVGTG